MLERNPKTVEGVYKERSYSRLNSLKAQRALTLNDIL